MLIKKMMNPCSNEPLLKREGTYVYTKERTSVFSLNTVGLVCTVPYLMNKTWDWRKMFITRANAASWLSSCSSPSQPFLCGQIALWLWVLKITACYLILNLVFRVEITKIPASNGALDMRRISSKKVSVLLFLALTSITKYFLFHAMRQLKMTSNQRVWQCMCTVRYFVP